MEGLYCPSCEIGIDDYQMIARRCNNCLHAWENYHVIPNNDSKEHTLSHRCSCSPEVKVEGENMIVVHSAFDGRLGVEWANEILKNNNQ